jgi:AraC-like DNA-binding protein
MLGDKHFKLQLNRLQSSDSWVGQSRNENEFTIVFLKGGIGKYVVSDAIQRLVPGSILVFNDPVGGKLYADERSECVFHSFSLVLEDLFPLFASNEISLLHHVKANFKHSRIYPSGSRIAAECRPLFEMAQTQSGLQHRSQLLAIMAVILSEELKNVHINRSGRDWAEDHMIQVFDKLSSAELLNLSVDDLAAKFSCSRRHLNRLFHQHFGLSITSLRMELRLLKAVSLLRNPREKIINVAEQCGFNHLGLFNTCFKKRYGASPGQWRKSNLGAEKPSPKKNADGQTCPLQANGLCPWGGQTNASNQPAEAKSSGRATQIAGRFAVPGHQGAAANVRPGTTRTPPGNTP